MTNPTPQSSFGALMRGAVLEYEATTGEKLNGNPLLQAECVEDVVKYTEKSFTDFKQFRHDESKWDKIRTALATALQPVGLVATALGAATGNAWPPCAAVFTAINFVVSAASRVRNGFDDLQSFLEDIGSYLSSLSVLDDDLPQYRLVQVETKIKHIFAAVLALCGISTLYIKQGRFKRGMRLAFSDKDVKLKEAHDRLEKAVKELGIVVKYSTHRNTNIIREELKELHPIKEDLQALRKTVDEHANPQQQIEEVFGKHTASETIFQEKKKDLVSGTAIWILDDVDYIEWSKEDWEDELSPFLWILGGPGTGKSCLACSILHNLQTISELYRQISLAFCFFPSRSSREADRSLKSALCNMILQISTHDPTYRKNVATFLAKDKNVDHNSPRLVWRRYIADQYPKTSTRKLFLTFVGVDKMDVEDQNILQDLLKEIFKDKLRIRALLVGQPSKGVLFHEIDEAYVPQIEVTNETIEEDMKLYIEHRVQKSKTLRKLDQEMKEKITADLMEIQGGFGLASLQLEILEAIRQCEDIPAALEQLPEGYKAALENSLDQISQDLSSEECKANRILFSWLSHCYSNLSINQLCTVIAMKSRYKQFDVRENVNNLCASILEVGAPFGEEDDESDDGTDDLESSTSSDDSGSVDSNNTDDGSKDNDEANTDTTTETTEEVNDEETIVFRLFAYHEIFQDKGWTAKYSQLSSLVDHYDLAEYDFFLTILQTLSMLPTTPMFERSRVLEEYSVLHFEEHLFDLGIHETIVEPTPDKPFPTEHHVFELVTALYELFFANVKNSSLAIENWGDELYLPFTSQAEEPTKAWEHILSWLKMSKAMDHKDLKPAVAAWADTVIKSQWKLIMALAKEHVGHWLCEVDSEEASRLVQYAKKALLCTEFHIKDPEKLTTDDVLRMANVFPDIQKNDCSNRAIGSVLKEIKAFSEALEYFDQALSLAEDNLSRFHTLSVTANALYEQENLIEAISVANSALALDLEKAVIPLEGNALNTYHKSLYQVYYVIANCLSATVDKSSAIEAFTKMRDVVKDSDFDIYDGENGVYSLSKIVDLLAEQEDWGRLVSEVCSWTASEFSDLMATDSIDRGRQNESFAKAAKLSSQEIAFRECYQAAIEAEDLDEEYPILLQYQLAYACWYVFTDEDGAWKLLQQVVDGTESGSAAREARTKARQLIMDIISSHFQTTSTNWVRLLLVEAMASTIPKRWSSVYNSLPAVQLAGAYLVVGERKEAKEILDEGFHICIDALKDSVGSNDKEAFILLARILFFAGLEREARTSLSAVFSITDRSIRDSVEHKDAESTEIRGKVEVKNDENNNKTAVEIDVSVHVACGLVIGKLQERGLKSSPQQVSGGGFEEVSTQDLDRNVEIICAGCCSESPRNFWAPKDHLHMCVICSDTFLCQPCYEKRAAQNQNRNGDCWKRICGKDHRYLKGPIEGWGGVENGMLKIGKEELLFAHWLRDVERIWASYIDDDKNEELA